MPAAGRKVVLGVSGSIAAMKSPEIVRLLVDAGFDVTCLATRSALSFVSPLVLATFSGKPVISEMYGPDAHLMPHIKLANEANLFLVAPASITLLGRFAHGLADDIVTLTYLTTTAPVMIAPAMHPTMWEHPATQANVALLKERGAKFLGPHIGPLADNTKGAGRMVEPQVIAKTVIEALAPAH